MLSVSETLRVFSPDFIMVRAETLVEPLRWGRSRFFRIISSMRLATRTMVNLLLIPVAGNGLYLYYFSARIGSGGHRLTYTNYINDFG